ncbi:hypothetical protein TRFO_11101 [Tritrichomonas foetus]|uniref:Uncharacterized protein n=1 Tax=Tritrichomonas foetus TaxID=1144522 RepID=A0A1J4J5G1_9EUKA|nr:hypothetical protein TRFO_11101 [Tritrichomonas foetus]|eukprot:OHS94480.1 hypothetical protein TRFO_11101 [Tritrichomonas foetus]
MKISRSALSSRKISSRASPTTEHGFFSVIPKTEKSPQDFDPDFIFNELNNRVAPFEPEQPGFCLPQQAKLERDYWNSYAYTSNKPSSRPASPFITCDMGDDYERKFTYVRMGDTQPHFVKKYARTPDLPPQTRKPSSPEKNPHFNERQSRVTTRNMKIEKPVEEYVSWKYFGDTDNICGCYTAKIPIKMKNEMNSRHISRLPNGTNKLKIKKVNQKTTNRNLPRRDLFELSIKRPPPKPELRDIIRSTEENHDFDEYLDEETETYMEYRGKMMPLKYSSINRSNMM